MTTTDRGRMARHGIEARFVHAVGRRALARTVVGSVTTQVLALTHTPVPVVR